MWVVNLDVTRLRGFARLKRSGSKVKEGTRIDSEVSASVMSWPGNQA